MNRFLIVLLLSILSLQVVASDKDERFECQATINQKAVSLLSPFEGEDYMCEGTVEGFDIFTLRNKVGYSVTIQSRAEALKDRVVVTAESLFCDDCSVRLSMGEKTIQVQCFLNVSAKD